MKSIRTALIVRLSVLLVAALLIVASGLYVFLKERLTSQFDETLTGRAHLVSTLLEWEHGRVAIEADPDSLGIFHDEWFEVWLADKLVARTETLETQHLPWNEPFFNDLVGRQSVRGVAMKVLPRAELGETSAGIPTLTLVLARDRSLLDADLRACFWALLVASMVLCVALPLITIKVVTLGLRPIDALAGTIATLDVHSLSLKLSNPGLPGELVPIARRLDELMERLSSSFARERRFTADVAHELRTPIAELRALSEVALTGPDKGGVHEPVLRDAHDVALQMERLVGALLALARAESGMLATQGIPLGDAIRQAWKPLEAGARARGIVVHFPSVDSSVLVQAESMVLDTIVANLLGNAVAHAPEKSEVHVTLSASMARVELCIENDDTTLTDDDLSHVFEPFWRKDVARTDGSHSGVGLALAKASASAIGGELSAGRPGFGRIQFVLRMARA